MTRFEAVIFDLDGVLWDGEPLHRVAFDEVLASWGQTVDDEEYAQLLGTSVEFTWDWTRDRFRPPVSAEQFWDAYSRAFLRLLQRPVDPLPGAAPLLVELKRREIPVGVASSSLGTWVRATLEAIGLAGYIDTVVSGSDVANGKPAPDIYLAAAEQLRVAPGHCLAIEDTATGIAAARAAGMFAIQLRAASNAPPLPEADLVLDSLAHFDLTQLAPAAAETPR